MADFGNVLSPCVKERLNCGRLCSEHKTGGGGGFLDESPLHSDDMAL